MSRMKKDLKIERAEIDDILQRYSCDPANLIMALQDIQTAFNYLPEEAIDILSQQLAVPRSQIYSAASFYKCFSLEPLGRHKVDVCTGTACHVRGADRLINQLSNELGIKPGETTEDKEVTLNSVHCVGACALGPVVVIDGEYHGEMTPTKLTKTVKKCCSGEGTCAGSVDTHPSCIGTSSKEGIPRRLESADELEKVRREMLQK